jgi:hypothetical protein
MGVTSPVKKELAIEDEAHRLSLLAKDFSNETDWNKDIIERRSRWLLGIFCDELDISALP